jgi:hypothetical protein
MAHLPKGKYFFTTKHKNNPIKQFLWNNPKRKMAGICCTIILPDKVPVSMQNKLKLKSFQNYEKFPNYL